MYAANSGRRKISVSICVWLESRTIQFRIEEIEIESSDVVLRNLFIIPEKCRLILEPHRIKFKIFISAVPSSPSSACIHRLFVTHFSACFRSLFFSLVTFGFTLKRTKNLCVYQIRDSHLLNSWRGGWGSCGCFRCVERRTGAAGMTIGRLKKNLE